MGDELHRLEADERRRVHDAIPSAVLDVYLLPALEKTSFAPGKRTFPL